MITKRDFILHGSYFCEKYIIQPNKVTLIYYISRKSDRPLLEAYSLVIHMCTVQLEQPSIPASTIGTGAA